MTAAVLWTNTAHLRTSCARLQSFAKIERLHSLSVEDISERILESINACCEVLEEARGSVQRSRRVTIKPVCAQCCAQTPLACAQAR
ncbi:hypothetical protein PENSPDRAFT_658120 [Peniophora sp. CONT]|nr:hypothetical protein PENSPDRAFT_658120 [Peniophora sp. CONT]